MNRNMTILTIQRQNYYLFCDYRADWDITHFDFGLYTLHFLANFDKIALFPKRINVAIKNYHNIGYLSSFRSNRTLQSQKMQPV